LAETIELIQSRYGWSDEYILSLPYARFIQIAMLIAEAKTRESKERMVDAAFIAWLLNPKGHKKFKDYLKSIKMLDFKSKVQVNGDLKQIKDEAIKKANEVLEKFRKAGGSNGAV